MGKQAVIIRVIFSDRTAEEVLKELQEEHPDLYFSSVVTEEPQSTKEFYSTPLPRPYQGGYPY